MPSLDPNCNLCGQEIRWTDNPATGKLMPINADGTPHFNTCPAFKNHQARIDASSSPKTAQEAPKTAQEMPRKPVETQPGAGATSAPKAGIVPRKQFSALDIAEVANVTGIPRGFIMLIGEKGKERPFVMREGLLYKGERKGYRAIQIEIVEETEKCVKAKATLWPKLTPQDYEVLNHLPSDPAVAKLVLDQLAPPFVDYGSASEESVKMRTLVPYLRELASTRASNRVLRLFTACGLTSVEETADVQDVEEVENP